MLDAAKQVLHATDTIGVIVVSTQFGVALLSATAIVLALSFIHRHQV